MDITESTEMRLIDLDDTARVTGLDIGKAELMVECEVHGSHHENFRTVRLATERGNTVIFLFDDNMWDMFATLKDRVDAQD